MPRGRLRTCGRRWWCLRRAVEALGPALKENRAPDYSLTLGQIAKAQATVCEHLAAMEGHPALRLTPAAFGEQVERAVAEASRKVLRDAEGAARAISGASQDAQAMLGSARTREAQNWRLLAGGRDRRRGGPDPVPAARVPARAQPAVRLASGQAGDRSFGRGRLERRHRADEPRRPRAVESDQ